MYEQRNFTMDQCNKPSLFMMQESVLVMENAQHAIEIIIQSLASSKSSVDENLLTLLNEEVQMMTEEINKLHHAIQKQLQVAQKSS